MSDTHFWTVIAGGNPDYRDDTPTHFGPFDSYDEAKHYAMPFWPNVRLCETVLKRLIESYEVDKAEWERANPPGSENNPIPVNK
jgi:hypothetical protein